MRLQSWPTVRASLTVLLLLSVACDGVALDALDVDPRAPSLERGLIAMGVARLTTRHAAALLSAIDADDRCGFASPAAKASLQLTGMPGDDGSATWSVKDCVLDFQPPQRLEADCEGNELWVSGRAIVSATRTVRGVITTDPEKPIAPDGSDSARIALTVTVQELSVGETSQQTQMIAHRGTLSIVAVPRLAVSQSLGLCTVPTPQLTLEDVQLNDADLELSQRGREVRVAVPEGKFSAQVGEGAQHENWLEGALTVWETRVEVPTRTDRDGLIPGYDRAAFVKSFECRKDLQQPLSHVCPPPREKPAQAAAALSVKLVGVIARALEKDTACGFASPMVKEAAVPMGTIGTKGTAVWTLPAPCTLTFAPGTIVEKDCMGGETLLEGTVSVTGTKSVRGYLTGDPSEPVVPTTSTPATLALSIQPTSIRMSDSTAPHVLTLRGGRLTGTVEPKTVLDRAKRVCSIATPAARVTIAHEATQVDVVSGDISVPLVIATSTLEARSGPENRLTGTVAAAGQLLHVPSANAAPVLDPAFDPGKFEASFMCDANLELPANEEACSFARPLAEGAARLMVRNAAAVAKLVNDNGGCGFQNEDLLQNPYLVIGSPGQLGRMGWFARCNVGGSRRAFNTDCNQVTTTVEGVASAQTTRVVDGLRDEICGGLFNLFCADSIIPIKSDAVVFDLRSVQLSNFGVGTDDARLVVNTGTLSAVVKPMQGRRRNNGPFDIGTPVVGVSDLKLSAATVTLQQGKKKFTFPIQSSELKAFSGAFAGQRNSLSGKLTVDGVLVDLGTLELQPGYTQAAFDQSYACTQNLTAVLVP